MSYHIKEVRLDKSFERYSVKSSGPQEGTSLPNLAKVNIFVGENNSGKSKFLRHLSTIQKLEFVPHVSTDAPWKTIAAVHNTFLSNCLKAFDEEGINDGEGIRAKIASIGDVTFTQEASQVIYQISELAQRLLRLRQFNSYQVSSRKQGADAQRLLHRLNQFAATWFQNSKQIGGSEAPPPTFAKIYIPTLRGLRTLVPDTDIYSEKTKQDYFTDGFQPEIFTGQGLYENVKQLLLGTLKDRQNVRSFEQFLSKSFFENRPVALIPRLKPPVLHIKIGHEVERPIHQLGDGIQSIIILTFPLFANPDKNVLLFCEEPELYLHPGLQRVLLAAFMGFQNHQYFLTTHSNHFLDLTLDFPSISVFTFQKQFEGTEAPEQEARFEIQVISNEDRRSLELLGVRNSSVFLSNCTIWVEGITDRRYYRKFLELYQDSLPNTARRFKEDLHFSFVEYGGACITHWSFLDTENDPIDVTRLCGKLFLIADGDTATTWKGRRHEKLEQKLGSRYYRLKCREAENLLPPEVLKATLSAYGETDFQNFSQTDYQSEALGSFIEHSVIKGQRKRSGTYSDNGSITDKVGFCSKALDAMKSFDSLSTEAKEIAKSLYTFIAANSS